MNYQDIIDKYYPEENELKHILLVHSRSVADKALSIVDRHSDLHLDRQFVEEAAMLHDIGIFKCNAPSIQCFGEEPYVCHGRIGAELLRRKGYPRHARVCERHTGAGLTKKEIVEQGIPLPPQDFLPETEEEKLICRQVLFQNPFRCRKDIRTSCKEFGEVWQRWGRTVYSLASLL